MNSLPQAGLALSGAGQMGPPSTLIDVLREAEEAQRLERKKLQWASWLDKEYVKCKNARVQHERQWYLNLAFNAGRHYVVPFDSPVSGTRLTVPRVPPHRVRLVINLVRKAIVKECAKLTMSKPIPTVLPATNENEDLTAAMVSEAILKAQFADPNFEEEYYQWAWWGSVCGKSFMKSYYSPYELDYNNMTLPDRPTFPDGRPMPDAVIQQIPELKRQLETPVPAKGKICIEALSPFHVYVPDLMVTGLEKQPYIIEVRTKHPEWVKKTYGVEVMPDTRAQSSIMETAFLATRSLEEHLDAVIIKECWIKPDFHPDFPEGGYLVVAGDKVLDYRDKWFLPFPEFPYYEYNGLPTGQFYCDSRVVDLIPLQKEYNKKRSQITEILNTMGKPKFFYQEGSVNIRKISSEPGQGIPYKAGYNPPQQVNGIEVPTSMIQEVQQLRTEFDDISGQHEISQGDTPSGVTSGTAISYLQEQDDTSFAYQVASIERAVARLGSHYLKYITKWWPDERIIRVAGRNNMFESIHWKKSAAEGNTDVKVQTGSALPFSKAARQALITEMMQNGFLSPDVGMEVLELGYLDKAMEDYLVDKRQATRENIKHQDLPDSFIETFLSPPPGQGFVKDEKGQWFNPQTMQPFQAQSPIPVNSWDNHEAHVQFHDLFRKTQEFEALSTLKKKALELHVQTHKIAMMAAQVNTAGMPLNEQAAGQQSLPDMQAQAGGGMGQAPSEPAAGSDMFGNGPQQPLAVRIAQ